MAQTELAGMERRIAEILINELKLEQVTVDTFDPEVDLIEELGIDSMDMTVVVLVLQDEYKIKIDEDHYSQLKTVRRIAQYIQAIQTKAQA
jgi:acyl carrier protein